MGYLPCLPLVFLLLVLLVATISNGLIVRSPAKTYKHRHRALIFTCLKIIVKEEGRHWGCCTLLESQNQ